MSAPEEFYQQNIPFSNMTYQNSYQNQYSYNNYTCGQQQYMFERQGQQRNFIDSYPLLRNCITNPHSNLPNPYKISEDTGIQQETKSIADSHQQYQSEILNESPMDSSSPTSSQTVYPWMKSTPGKKSII